MDRTDVLAVLQRGAAAGAVATAAMSAVMLAAGRAGLVGRQPPEAIARTASRRVTGTEPEGAAADVAGAVAHLGFGAAAGVVWTALPSVARAVGGRVPLAGRGPAPVRGAVFGLVVWAVSYLGWVPRVLGALPSAEDDRDDRVAVMVLAHVVYGAALAELEQRWRD